MTEHKRVYCDLPGTDHTDCKSCQEILKYKRIVNSRQPVPRCEQCGQDVFTDDSVRYCQEEKCAHLYHKYCGKGWDNKRMLCPYHSDACVYCGKDLFREEYFLKCGNDLCPPRRDAVHRYYQQQYKELPDFIALCVAPFAIMFLSTSISDSKLFSCLVFVLSFLVLLGLRWYNGADYQAFRKAKRVMELSSIRKVLSNVEFDKKK